MIHSIVPIDMIFSKPEACEITCIQKDGILLETENGQVRRIISTNPSDYLEDITKFQEFASKHTNAPQ